MLTARMDTPNNLSGKLRIDPTRPFPPWMMQHPRHLLPSPIRLQTKNLESVNIRSLFKAHNTTRQHLCRPNNYIYIACEWKIRWCLLHSMQRLHFSYSIIGGAPIYPTPCEAPTNVNYAIAKNVWSKHNQVNWEGVSVLDSEPYTRSRKVWEAIHIRHGFSLTLVTYAQRGLLTVYTWFCKSVCYHVFCHHAQEKWAKER